MRTNFRFLRRTTTSSLVSVVLQCTRQDLNVNNGDTVMNELMNASQPLRQKFQPPTRIRSIEANRSSSVVPCGVTWRQQRSSSCEWVWLEETEPDYGFGISRVCVAPEEIAKSVPVVETGASRQGQTYHTADGKG